MKSIIFLGFILSASLVMADDNISDREIKTILIENSIKTYGKACACPYSKSPNGGQCGLNSAYSKVGRLSILCYPSNITKKMIEDYREQNGLSEK